MGLKIMVDVFQRELTKLIDGLEGVRIYIDDMLVVIKSTY